MLFLVTSVTFEEYPEDWQELINLRCSNNSREELVWNLHNYIQHVSANNTFQTPVASLADMIHNQNN